MVQSLNAPVCMPNFLGQDTNHKYKCVGILAGKYLSIEENAGVNGTLSKKHFERIG